MPIILDDLTTVSQQAVKSYTPKFFDSKLTGAGKKIGLLSEARNPSNIDKKKQRTLNENINCRKHKFSNGTSDVTGMPLYVLSADAWGLITEMPLPDLSAMKPIGEQTHSYRGTRHAYARLDVHSLILEEKHLGPKVPIKRELTVCYQLTAFVHNDKSTDDKASQVRSLTAFGQHSVDNQFYTDFTCNPARMLDEIATSLEASGFTIDKQALFDVVNDYDLYAGVCARSEEWSTSIDKTLSLLFDNVKTNASRHDVIHETTRALRHIEDYNVPLDLYRSIYHALQATFPPDIASSLCKENLNLLLSDTLNNLNQSKAQLTVMPQPSVASVDPKFTREQKAAITSSEPLVMVQAGAGTGKSSVILERIKYMVDSGVNPTDITVLSFTNAAADHITELNPYVHSMTIARMIHSIYSENFKTHELSSIDTIMNSLDIYFPDDDFARTFRHRLLSIAKNDRDSFTRMNNFVEQNYDAVIATLDAIRQTSLELEIIICYQQIDNLTEPADVQSKYLIIDEVQDNSIFEFVYTLKYVDKHKESLYIVGDCSQTLYEFRASNPKALNVLEGSGVFATYQLQTNFRSNQEILDFANVALANIEANQYANIQLHANSLAPVTEKSFTDKVKLHYEQLIKVRDLDDTLTDVFATQVYDYVDECLKRGEQVAFLAFTRNHVNRMQNLLENHYKRQATQPTIVNLVPEKVFNQTVFSTFIMKYWDEVQFIPPRSITGIIGQAVMHRLDYLVYNAAKAHDHVQHMIMDWQAQEKPTIDAWQAQHASGQLTLAEFLDLVKENMLQFEIKRNAVKQSLISRTNEETKKAQAMSEANLILSTIHSAKGLEFQNVVLIYRNDNDMDEEKKRMYYVAFTRAMNTELVLAFDTCKSPKIQGDYNAIVETLRSNAAATAAMALGDI